MAKRTLIQTFCESGDHQALRAARAWCDQMGLVEADTRAAAHKDRPFGNYLIISPRSKSAVAAQSCAAR